jgi:hypothetical protein
MAEFKLIKEIISLSVSDTWEIAKTEWELNEIYIADEPETCLCGRFPIIELCELKNTKNKELAVVGNCCVKKFIGLPSDKIFQAVKRVRKDGGKGLNGETIELAHSKKWINDWEYTFYIDTFRKRKLSEKQLIKRRQINEKVLLKINKDKK